MASFAFNELTNKKLTLFSICARSLTVVLCSLLCILLAIAIVNRKPWRHFVQVFLCVMELYGGTLTIGAALTLHRSA
jgi:hypothetical protein